MIYSADINKVCGLCRHAEKIENNEDEMFCTLKNENKSVTFADCKRFDYDIFKKPVHKKRRLKTAFSADDFSLED